MKNCRLTGFLHGVVLIGEAARNTLTGNTSYAKSGAGFALDLALDNVITENIAENNGRNGFQLVNSGGNVLLSNSARGNHGTGGFAMVGPMRTRSLLIRQSRTTPPVFT